MSFEQKRFLVFQDYENFEFKMAEDEMGSQVLVETVVRQRMDAEAKSQVCRAHAVMLRERFEQFQLEGDRHLQMLTTEIESLMTTIEQVSASKNARRYDLFGSERSRTFCGLRIIILAQFFFKNNFIKKRLGLR